MPRKTTARRTRGKRRSGISEKEIFIGVIVLAIVFLIIRAISNFFNQYPWVGWTLLVVGLAIAIYAAIKYIKTKLDRKQE